jgi:hypothetical protein
MARTLVVRCLLVLAATAVVIGQNEPELFREATSTGDVGPLEKDAIRRRLVTIVAEALPASADARPSTTLLLNLFDDVRLTATASQVTRTATGYVWAGRIPTIERGTATFAVAGGVVSGSVATPDGDFTIRYVGDGVYAISQVNRAVLPPERGPVIPDGAAFDHAPSALADDGSTIDLLVVYTPAARAARGGTDAIESLIDLGVSETNQAYASSGAIQRLRLVHKSEAAYTEAADMGLDLSRLQNTSDGHLDVVHSLRDAHGADLVHLIVHGDLDACGIAYLMTSVSTAFAPFAFGVTDDRCVSPNYSFPHELGHNMGLHHDIYMTGPGETGAFPYSRGYVNQAAFAPGAPISKRWRDIMAYNNQCAASGFDCSRLLAFSSPVNTHTGDPMGNASTADAVRSLNETRVTVSNFRTAIPLSNFSVSDASVIEGHSGTTNARFTISLSPAAASTTSVSYATGDGTATSSSSDYTAAAGTATLPAGGTSATIDIAVNGDLQFELPETFALVLSNPSGATIADGAGAATIKNDDFTDHPLTTGLIMKTVHVDELRSMINAVRTARGMGSVTFESLAPQVTVIRASHLAELRAALPSACTPSAYTDPTLTPGATTIKAAHIAEIRAAALACQ